MTVLVTFQSSQNFDESSAQHNGVEILELECQSTDFDWGGFALVPVGEEDAIYVAEITYPLTNEDGEHCGTGWIIHTEDDFARIHPGIDVLAIWPQLAPVLGCTFSRVYTQANDEAYKQAVLDEEARIRELTPPWVET